MRHARMGRATVEATMTGVVLGAILLCGLAGIFLGRVEHPSEGDAPVDRSHTPLPKAPREPLHEEGPFR